MSRYRPQRARACRSPPRAQSDLDLLEFVRGTLHEHLGLGIAARGTGNYQALDRGPKRGARTPIEWPPQVRR
jgi:hypothetical protein